MTVAASTARGTAWPGPDFGIDSIAPLEQLMAGLRPTPGTAPAAAAKAVTGGGAPALVPPAALDPDALLVLLGQVESSLGIETVRNAGECVKRHSLERQDAVHTAMQQLELAARKARESAKKVGQGKTAGWVRAAFSLLGAVLGVVGAVLATGATGGAGAVLVGVAVVGVLLAMQDVANMAVQQRGVQVTAVTGQRKQLDLSFAGMIEAIVDQQIKDGTIVLRQQDADGSFIDVNGRRVQDPKLAARAGTKIMDADALAKWKMGWSVATSAIVALGTVVAGFRGAAKLEQAAVAGAEAGAAISRVATGGERVAQLGNAVAHLAEGTSAIIQGDLNIQVAGATLEADRARASKTYLDATAQAIAQRLAQSQDLMRTLVERLNGDMEQLFALIGTAATGTGAMARNMS